ncbi:MAG: TIM barrel protein [Devosia sp.]|nr:TIM barrel protein [Devosia sp.]
MAAPQLGLAAFFALARELGLTDVEIRNDIAGEAILDGTPASTVTAAARQAGVSILTINALQRFNEWTPTREAEATALAAYARDCGAKALILVPTNDGTGRREEERHHNLRLALTALQPILERYGITGLVEPLGFEACSLRSKREAVDGIRAVSGEAIFRVTHDTFHHRLAGEPDIFPEMTGLVHVSGVEEKGLAFGQMRDAHRVLVGTEDRIGNIDQLRHLRDAGYTGPISFEPFAAQLKTLQDPAGALRQSMAFIAAQLAETAA